MQYGQVAIIGGGPAGLMAAETLAQAGVAVTLYEAMPTVARKFLMAGKSGLNITHAEDYARFTSRFGRAKERLDNTLDNFTPTMLRAWVADLGQETFIGTSGRVFPTVMKASPLLRAWLHRLEALGVEIRTRHQWLGYDSDALVFQTPDGRQRIEADAIILALGGASWPRLGSTAAWVPWLRERQVEIDDFQPANCGFNVAWSDYFRERFAGEPLKSVATTSAAGRFEGEFVVTKHGVEGSVVYAHSAVLRDQIAIEGSTTITIDLAPDRSVDRLSRDMNRQSRKESLSNRLRKGAGLSPVKSALLRECEPNLVGKSAEEIAALIKTLPLRLQSPRPIDEAISSAGGITWSALDENYMLKVLPGTFAAGEMLDWEAPTGGYLLTACFATGKAAAKGIIKWFESYPS
ncbi:TIGR03862 family flavoprotein [Agrobacterium larrymoorei]|uniref:TIGR03862 family flavoprotein n=1 Tax=Agrobacterium larrymoorei TaxID=160699 RepID=UPI0015727FFE|nr:TIGR03862 family flavoprotein [Agrobacterium larrymoorei]NTJ44390.1 TIGR03862 family flavoprotein [Agrobacterium larrymoorei]